ncbi:MAG: formylglycine-generating enzyme family protein [Acidobacteria bacterium]|nr:formylglycine-generating enzyme family protein [Acidobacteriota bacterium]
MPAPHYRQRLKHLDDLLHINYQKLAEFERELAITADTSKSFELKTKIKEIKAVIDEHETEYDHLEAKLSANTPTDPVQPPSTPPPVSDPVPLPLKPTFKNSLGMEFVLIPAGSFLMGSTDAEVEAALADAKRYDQNAKREWFTREQPQHRVTFDQPFYLGKFQVTQAQWQTVMGNNPSSFKGDTLPVERVSWNDCQEFLKKLNAKKDGYLYRLPSEAEWEYACRAGTTTPFSFGETITTDQVNYDGKYPYGNASKGEYRQKTTPVGSFPANVWGLHDMHGNVWEWCQDWFQDTYAGAPDDGSARESGSDKQFRVMRGGSWFNFAKYCRSANRDRDDPVVGSGDFGFRVVAARTLNH